MRMRIKAFAALTGVSVRTLHYYDEIGLLQPAAVDARTGYRFYDDRSLLRMQEILFYRELDFPLAAIAEILSAPEYDKTAAFAAQKQLLILKKERLERLIAALDAAMKGEIVMDAFDNSRFEQYKDEVRERWGGTAAYAEYAANAGRDPAALHEAAAGMERIMDDFAVCMQSGAAPDSAEAQALVRDLQAYITAHFYTCTDEILSGLGQMYTADERFRQNLDRRAPGTAAFIGKAIERSAET
ncbi:MAG: MerR family transcriptional regulator [Clostridia bacterium]|nr:MerR family transcriptional regulator [Clostridia bacterium]